MKGKLRPVSGLICDDVRFEADGRVSLMGILPPTVAVPEFPHPMEIHPVMLLHGEKVGDCSVTTRLRWKGEVRWEVESELSVSEIGGTNPLPMGRTVAGFDGPGELALELETDGKTTVLSTFQIVLANTDEPEAKQPVKS